MPDTESPTQKRPPQAWLMVLWLVCTIVVIGFALISYVSGWWYPYLE
jgi:polyferredoxin